ncbi:MAG: hypothetical protein HW421_4030 [Ignavibacteria bacterium]|nr:hypothetical protein [Ignavibacteria bacterium]
MRIFLDISALIKLYHYESGSDEVDKVFDNFSIEEIYLSELTKIEFQSAIWKKVRIKEITKKVAKDLINAFENDFNKYNFININSDLIDSAQVLIMKFGIEGLRTLDSIQLASIEVIKNKISIAISTDDLLEKFIKQLGIKTISILK